MSSKFGGKKMNSVNWDIEAAEAGMKMGTKSEESLDRIGNMGSDSQELIVQRESLGKGVQVQTSYGVEREELDRRSDVWQLNNHMNAARNKVSIQAKRVER